MTFPSTLYMSFIFFGTGFEVFTVVRIYIAAWVRTPSSLMHDYGYFGGAVWVCLHSQLEDSGSMS
jgi:uncharacterized membrane protein YobD (UPF0266 family)